MEDSSYVAGQFPTVSVVSVRRRVAVVNQAQRAGQQGRDLPSPALARATGATAPRTVVMAIKAAEADLGLAVGLPVSAR